MDYLSIHTILEYLEEDVEANPPQEDDSLNLDENAIAEELISKVYLVDDSNKSKDAARQNTAFDKGDKAVASETHVAVSHDDNAIEDTEKEGKKKKTKQKKQKGIVLFHLLRFE